MLMETAKRSRKAPTKKTHFASDESEAAACDGPDVPRLNSPPPPPENTPTFDGITNPLFLEIQRATSPGMCRRRPSWASMRSHHSFRVPELDPIASSESEGEGSSPASPTTSRSQNSDHAYMYTEATRKRESVDEHASGYLLELAAKAAEKQLREQAMAAFPNDDYHEPVAHYIGCEADDSESQGSGVGLSRISSTDSHLERIAMQQHQQALEKEKQKDNERKRRQAELHKPDNQAHSPWANAGGLYSSAATNAQKDGELDRMRKDARPPMLGKDIQFPRCPSPEPARFDPTQGTDAVRISMCYLSEQSAQADKGEGLWCGRSSKHPSAQPSLYSNASSRSHTNSHTGGLWGGCCVNTGESPSKGPTGLLTPRIEIDNPMSPCPTPNRTHLPPTPPHSNEYFACIDEKLSAQAAIDDAFSDDFVTQVYNYLSLGYPSIARMFDDELARISNYSVKELRQDDHLPTSRGYIRLGPDGNLADADITEENCMRWRALRIYVREWAKQQPDVAADATAGGIGIAVRRGSWAI